MHKRILVYLKSFNYSVNLPNSFALIPLLTSKSSSVYLIILFLLLKMFKLLRNPFLCY